MVGHGGTYQGMYWDTGSLSNARKVLAFSGRVRI